MSKYQTEMRTYTRKDGAISKWSETLYYACYASFESETPFAYAASESDAIEIMKACVADFDVNDPCGFHRNSGAWIMSDWSIVRLTKF